MAEPVIGFESDDRFSIRVTNDLAGDLAALSAGVFLEKRGDESRPALPLQQGVMLCFEDHPVAAMGFAVELNRTLTITDPVFLRPGSTNTRERWTRRLLAMMTQKAGKIGCETLRSLQPVGAPASRPWMPRVLAESGFLKRAGIEGLETRIPASGEHSTAIRRDDEERIGPGFSMELLTASQRSGGLRVALPDIVRQILADSHDLKELPHPDADHLVADWVLHQSTIALLLRKKTIVGVCVCAMQRDQSAQGSVSVSVLIQYLGVLPEFRRTGVAASAIAALPEILSRGCVTEAPISRLRVFCETANEPARALYAKCGFETCSEFSVWLKPVTRPDVAAGSR